MGEYLSKQQMTALFSTIPNVQTNVKHIGHIVLIKRVKKNLIQLQFQGVTLQNVEK